MSPRLDEKNKKIAARWGKAADFFYVAAQAMTPVAQIPLVNLIANPIVNGLWAGWSIAYSMAFKYKATLKFQKEQQERYVQAQSLFNKASYLVGAVATVAGFLILMPPLWPIIPILLPIVAIATVVSSILWATDITRNFYSEIKKGEGEKDAGHGWRVASQASAVLYSMGSIVIGALVVAALFTPVGWAVGAGAMTFGIAGAVACLAVFGISKFCDFQAYQNVKSALKAQRPEGIEMQSVTAKPKDEINVDLEPHKVFLPEFDKKLKEALEKRRALVNGNALKKEEGEGEAKGKEGEQGSEEPPHP